LHYFDLLIFFSCLPAGRTQCIDRTTALGQCALLASLREQLRATRKAAAHIIIAGMTFTTKVDGKCNNCELAKNTPPLCVKLHIRDAVHAVIMPRQYNLYFLWKPAGFHKKSESQIDASLSRQPSVKGERFVRYQVNAVMQLISFRA